VNGTASNKRWGQCASCFRQLGLTTTNGHPGPCLLRTRPCMSGFWPTFSCWICYKQSVFDPLASVVPENSNLENIEFTPDKIYSAIRKLKISGASGPDAGFPPRLFKTLASCLSAPLSLLFCLCRLVRFRRTGSMQSLRQHTRTDQHHACLTTDPSP